jgi:class 3 adenylate cyclase
MKRLAIFLVVLATGCGLRERLHAQTNFDSLAASLPSAPQDAATVLQWVNAAFGMRASKPQESLRCGEEALSLATKIGWQKGRALAFNEIGTSYLNRGDYPRAFDNYFKSLHIYEEGGDSLHAGTTLGNIGTAYFYQESYDKALAYFLKALSLARNSGDRSGEMVSMSNIGGVYYKLKDYGRSAAYLQAALRLAESLHDSAGIINQLSNLANIYAETGDYNAALNAYFKTLAIAEADSNKQAIAANAGNIGETYLDIVRDSAHRLGAAARAHTLQQAVSFLQRGIATAHAISYRDAEIDFLETLSETYALQGNYSEALDAYQQHVALRDATFNLAGNEKIAALENKRTMQLKDRDLRIAHLELAQKRHERWLYVAGLILLAFIAALLLKSARRQRRSNALLSKEKSRSEALLHNILPAEVAEELKAKGSAEARQYHAVSVLFTDFVNFTGAAQHFPPKAVVQELHECFSAFDAIIERHGLEKIKTIGDAYMAVCGLPVEHDDHAIRAVAAALDILQFISERSRAQRAFAIRIGIHSGPVVAGIVGTKKFAYDIWGDTVNTAARMEQHGMAGAINISQVTYELVKERYHCAYRGRVPAKHKGEVEMYFVSDRAEWDA